MDLADAIVIKQDNVFLVTARDGSLPAGDGHGFGLWYRDCRFLSAYELLIGGQPPVALQASDALGSSALHQLTDAERAVAVRWERSVAAPGLLTERLAVANHRGERVRLRLDLRLAADFEPMLAARGLVPRGAGSPARVEVDRAGLSFRIRGRDAVVRTTAVEFGEQPARIAPGPGASAEVRFEVDLAAGAAHELTLRFRVSESGAAPALARPAADAVGRTRVTTGDVMFDRVLARSLRDLATLRSSLGAHSYYSAGVPWYATLFGRDSLIAAMQMLAFEPDVAADTLRLLGGLLGREHDDAREEQPGKVLHELRVGEPAALGETPFARYYGTADATPLWLALLCDHADWSGSLGLFLELRPQVDAALRWVDRHGDLDGDGLIEYRPRTADGLVNQGWKDSRDGVPDAGGVPLEPPVALVEVQGYAIRALRGIATLLERDGDSARADELRNRAGRIEVALERFWLPGTGSYAIGLDASKRPGSGLTSNPGHLLWAGALSADRARSVRDTLMGDALFSGWGVRTLAAGHPAYNPIGYHTGSVWPHDTALFACGLREYGLDEDFGRLFGALLEAAAGFADHRLPELIGGHARSPDESPVPYPVACRPQAWAAGAIPQLLTAGLGLRPDGLSRTLRVVRPMLPPWLDWIEVEGLRVAGATVRLRLERSGDQVAVAEARADGDLEVLVEEAGEGRSAGAGGLG